MALQDLFDKAKTVQLYKDLQRAKETAQYWAQTVVNLSNLLLADANYIADASMDDKTTEALMCNKNIAYLESVKKEVKPDAVEKVQVEESV